MCIPKTIDNDIGIIDCSFGFNTAVEETRRAIEAAQVCRLLPLLTLVVHVMRGLYV